MPPTDTLGSVGVTDYRLPADTVTEVDVRITAAMTRPMPVAQQVIEVVCDGTTGFRYTIDDSNPSTSGTAKALGGMPGFRRGHKYQSITTVKVWCPSECIVTVRAVQANSIESLSSNSEFDAPEDDSPTIARIFDRNGNRVPMAFNSESVTVDDVDGRLRTYSGGIIARSTTGVNRRDVNVIGKTVVLNAKISDDDPDFEGVWRKTPSGGGAQLLGSFGRAVSFLTNQVAITNNTGGGFEDFRAREIRYGSLFDASDARLKRNVESLMPGTGLDEVLAMRPVSYEWIAEDQPGQQRGFIAQEMAQACPDAHTVANDDGTEGVQSMAILATAVRAIQQQNETIRQLQAAYADLASEIADLRAKAGPDAV